MRITRAFGCAARSRWKDGLFHYLVPDYSRFMTGVNQVNYEMQRAARSAPRSVQPTYQGLHAFLDAAGGS